MQATLTSFYGSNGSPSRPASQATSSTPRRTATAPEDGGQFLTPPSGRRRPAIAEHEELDLGTQELEPELENPGLEVPPPSPPGVIDLDDSDEEEDEVAESLTPKRRLDKGKGRAIEVDSSDSDLPDAVSPAKRKAMYEAQDSDTETAEDDDAISVVPPLDEFIVPDEMSPPPMKKAKRRLVKGGKPAPSFSVIVPAPASSSQSTRQQKARGKTATVKVTSHRSARVLDDDEDEEDDDPVDWTPTLAKYAEDRARAEKRRPTGRSAPNDDVIATSDGGEEEEEEKKKVVPPPRPKTRSTKAARSPSPVVKKKRAKRKKQRTPTPEIESDDEESDSTLPEAGPRQASHVSESEEETREPVSHDLDDDDLDLDEDALQEERLRPAKKKEDKLAALRAARNAKSASSQKLSSTQVIPDTSDEEEHEPVASTSKLKAVPTIDISSDDDDESRISDPETEATSPHSDEMPIDSDDFIEDDGDAEPDAERALGEMHEINAIQTMTERGVLHKLLLLMTHQLVYPREDWFGDVPFKETRKRVRRIIDEQLPSLIKSAGWTGPFNDSLDLYPDYALEDIEQTPHCEACGRSRAATFNIHLEGTPYDRDTYEELEGKALRRAERNRQAFAAGRHCQTRSQAYHELKHFEYSAYVRLQAALASYTKKHPRPKRRDEVAEWAGRLMDKLDQDDYKDIVETVVTQKERAGQFNKNK